MTVLARLAAVWLLASAALAHNRFGATPTPTPGPSLSPRFYLEASPQQGVARRQSGCASGLHPCDYIGALAVGLCCKDDSYCYIDNNSTAGCCALGSDCGSQCGVDRVRCNSTSTITTGTSTSTTLLAACCPRACTSTAYGCPSSLGGGCCPYGQACGTSVCLRTDTPTPSTSALVSQPPPGCTTSQIGCSSSLGGGCCANTQVCTFDNGPKCAPATMTPTGSGVAAAQDTGLSTGAKAGIGVGVVAGSAIIVGALTWFCVRQRRYRSQAAESHRRSVPRIVGGGGRAMTEATFDVPGVAAHAGGNQDYFGGYAGGGGLYAEPIRTEATSVGTEISADRGVPVEPHGPSDIAAPVEIDSRVSPGMLGPADARSQGTRSERSVMMQPPQAPYSMEGRFELHGQETPPPGPYVPSPTMDSPQHTPGQAGYPDLPGPQSPLTPESPRPPEGSATLTGPQEYQYYYPSQQ